MSTDTQDGGHSLATLVVTPPVDPRESAIGYALRLCEANGYSSPNIFLSQLRLTSYCNPILGGSKEALTALTLMSASAAERLAIRRPADKSYYLLGQRMRLQELSLTHHRVCPICIDTDGVYDASWHLSLITYCPIHGIPLASSCQDCGASFGMNRAGPGLCKCSTPIRCVAELPRCSDVTASLFQALREKLFCDPSIAQAPSAFSIFYAVSLPSFLGLIRRMCKFIRDHHPSCIDESIGAPSIEALAVAAEALQHFSNGLEWIHRVLGDREISQELVTAAAFSWFKGSHLERSNAPELSFVGQAICDLTREPCSAVPVRLGLSRYLARLRSPFPPDSEEFHKQWVRTNDVSNLTGCDPLNLSRAIRLKLISWRRGVRHQMAVSRAEIARLKPSSYIGLEIKDAAVAAGLPDLLFKRLSRSRIYIAQYIPHTGGPYSREDVLRLRDLIKTSHDHRLGETTETVGSLLSRTTKSMLNSTRLLVNTLEGAC